MDSEEFLQLFQEAAGDQQRSSGELRELLTITVQTVIDLLRNHREAILPEFGTLRFEEVEAPKDSPVRESILAGSPEAGEKSFYKRVRLPIPIGDEWKGEEVSGPADRSLIQWKANQSVLEPEQEDAYWSRIWSLVRERLLEEEILAFPGLGTFELMRQNLSSDSGGDAVLFVPSEGLENERPPESRIKFCLSETVREKARQRLQKDLLLLVPEGDLFFEMMEPSLKKEGYTVSYRHDATSLLKEFRNQRQMPATLLIDYRIEDAREFLRGFRGTRKHADVPIILIFPENVDPSYPEQLLVYGDDLIQEPFDVQELLSHVEELQTEHLEEGVLHHVHFRFPTRDETVEEAQEFMDELIEGSGLPEETQVEVRAAFREAMGNAAQHGNRYRRDKKVLCDYRLMEDRITFQVEDEGRGFDHEKYVERGESDNAIDHTREGHEEGKYGGFGIMLMLRTVDELTYNEKGNVVLLTKYLSNNGSESS